MNNILLFRPDNDNQEEFEIAKKTFGKQLVTQRSEVPKSSKVIGRYSVLPFYKELENDLKTNGSVLVHDFHNHRFIANFDYYESIRANTFKTYFDLREIPDDPNGFTPAYVVKGRTNSRKAQWNRKMYCLGKRQAIELAAELMEDPLIGQQGIIVREYEELEFLEEGINGQLFVNEHRFFFAKSDESSCTLPTLIAHGFYWNQSEKVGEIDNEGIKFAQKIANHVFHCKRGLYVVDIARTAKGQWKVVELNDGQMSGLSTINPYEFYVNLKGFYDNV